MSSPDPPPDPAPAAADDSAATTDAGAEDRFAEVREAAGAVVSSLRWLLEATERVVEDPEAFAEVAARGRSVVEAFTEGFRSQADPVDTDTDESAGADQDGKRDTESH